MAIDKSLLSGSTTLLVLKLLEDGEMYGYQMIEELRSRSDRTFELKAGTLYPLLHTLEERGDIEAYLEGEGSTRPRRYYRLTAAGRGRLVEKEQEWRQYVTAVEQVLRGGECLA